MNEFDILNGTDEFPYPQSLINTDFKNFNIDEIDLFLYKNHRFTSIDQLIKDLKKLSTELNETLLNLVNNDYNDFIKLGKSINGGYEIINMLIQDLKGFKSDLVKYESKFNNKLDNIEKTIQLRQELVKLKTKSKLTILLNDQIVQFDTCLNTEKDVDKLTGLYLSIIKTSEYLETDSKLLESLQSKVNSIQFEYISFIKQQPITIDIVSIYKLIGI
ncbi:unnamed protein product [Candida verbasci]|uniref:Conserved oligomeric Golgi complex subunit 2 n=1 Tax=Candida verbasci TaxID=1227364 RepID=A0A9W4X7U9_9ASCO|nr:unnamed protein product [Candida verbasci]